MLVKSEDREQLRMLADLAEDWSSVTNPLVGRLRIHLSVQLRGMQRPLLASSGTCTHAAHTHHTYIHKFLHHFFKE